MKKYDVGFNTETFRHYVVEADSEEEALAKGREAYYSGDDPYNEDDGVVQETGVMELTESEVARLRGRRSWLSSL